MEVTQAGTGRKAAGGCSSEHGATDREEGKEGHEVAGQDVWIWDEEAVRDLP